MKFVRTLILSALMLLPFVGRANAQYLWMDSNGDGVNTSADVMNANGTPTTVDVWINTAHNRDGSLAECNTADGDLATWNSFATHVNVSGGTATFGNYINQVAAFTIGCVLSPTAFATNNSTEMSQCQATGAQTPNGGGNIKIYTVTVTGTSGAPSLAFVPLNSLDQNFTSFGTACSGSEFDNTYKLGSDFFDNDGIGPPVGGNVPPMLNAPTTANATENQPVTITATATDADAADILTMNATGQPASLTFSSTPGVSPVTGTISGTPGFGDQGSYNIVWTVNDGHNPDVTATTALTVANVDRAPIVTAPATAAGDENTLITFTVSAADPDGEAILALSAAGTAITAGGTFTKNASNNSGTFSWTPSLTQSGAYAATFTASNGLSGSATTNITVNNVDRAPIVTAPATVSGASNSLINFTVTAADPDGDAIASLTGGPLPGTSTFTTNASNTSGTFDWTPNNTNVGTHDVTFTASNALVGTATTQITVTSGDRPPAVTAPATTSGDENTLITFGVTASDPDGDAITSLTASPLPSGAAFTANGPNTSGTFSWTPDFTQAGSYNVTFTAANALSGSATTAITVNNVDRAPQVVAPATASGTEGTLLTINVTASDPDGDAITSLTAAPLPTGATFTANASNTAGTFSWTPSLAQAGSYNVTFTAMNALSGSATTAITIADNDQAPVVTAPPTASGATGELITFTVTAADPDGDAITSLTASPLPAGATFTANASNTSGTFNWTPGAGDAGTYNVTFTAANALSGSDATEITVTSGDHAPVVTAPATASGDENTNINFTVTATDSDGDAITSLTAAPLPSGATFTANASNTAGTFDWTPDFTQSGTYNVTFTASNALNGSATTVITVNNVDRAPIVTAPATAAGDEGTLISFTVSASDPDGDAITSLTAAPLPSGATFTANAANTSGTFSWTPSFSQAGSHSVTFTAMNALSGSATTDITVNNVDGAPVVTAPATVSGAEETNINFTVSASDPDGDAITSLTATGTAITAGATFTANASNTSGTFDWTPGAGTAGSYSVTFTASNALSGSATTTVTVTGVNHDPIVTAPATASGDEGTLITFTVSATDQDGDNVSLQALGAPAGASFTDNGDNTGTFSWTPGFTQAGSYTVTFQGSDGNGGTGTATTVITVNDVNRAPTADANGPYSGVINVAIVFDGTGSTDPDGDALTYDWDFGDGSTGTGATPSHAYAAAGSYTVTLTVTDPGLLSNTATTTATVSSTLAAAAFTVGGNKTTSLGAGKPYTCVQIESVGDSFQNTDVVLASIKMVSAGTGSVSEILADVTKSGIDGDKNGNGVPEIVACFRKADLRLLFSSLPAGRNEVNVTIEGSLVTGATFSAPLTMIVKSTGAVLAASVSPNPLNPQAKLTFSTTKPGAIRVQMFDPQGRLVKTIADQTSAQAGYHDFTIDGRSASGSKLASGVYFVKVWSQYDGSEVKTITIMK